MSQYLSTHAYQFTVFVHHGRVDDTHRHLARLRAAVREWNADDTRPDRVRVQIRYYRPATRETQAVRCARAQAHRGDVWCVRTAR